MDYFDFSVALVLLKKGHYVYRDSAPFFLQLENDKFYAVFEGGVRTRYILNEADILAEDWVLAEESTTVTIHLDN